MVHGVVFSREPMHRNVSDYSAGELSVMILYHYCSNYVFHSIVTQKKVRMSLLSLSNDYKEGQHIIDVARGAIPDESLHKKDILKELQLIISVISAIGFCLSADGDVLSQWRGYADNAQGVAIGFDKEALDAATKQDEPQALITRFAPVAYDEKFLTKIIAADLEPVIEHYKSGKMALPRFGSLLMPLTDEDHEKDKLRHKQATSELFWKLMKIANYAYMVKAPFFDEEEEWRILTLVTNLDQVLDMPGAQFQTSSEKLKPFKDFPQKGFAPSAIKEVILGPRNQTPDEVVRLFLNSQGFDHVSIRRSSGSYR